MSVPGETIGVVSDQYGLVLCRRRRVLVERVSIDAVQRQRSVERHVLHQQTDVLHCRLHEQLQQSGSTVVPKVYDVFYLSKPKNTRFKLFLVKLHAPERHTYVTRRRVHSNRQGVAPNTFIVVLYGAR